MISAHRDVDAFVVVYSVSDVASFDDAALALQEIMREPENSHVVILVANKGDIVRKREVSEESKSPLAEISEGNNRIIIA